MMRYACLAGFFLLFSTVALAKDSPKDLPPLAPMTGQTGGYLIESTPLDPALYAQTTHRLVQDVHANGALRAEPFPNQGIDGKHPENTTDKTHFAIYVPESYKPDKSWGLLVYMSPDDTTKLRWKPLLEKRRLLLIVPQDVGNVHYRTWRVAMAVKSYQIMTAAYKINPDRIYLLGMSGGGRASSEAVICYSDIFTGAVFNCGVNNLRIDGHAPSPDLFDALPEFAKLARTRGRYYLYTGSADGNREETKMVYDWMKKWGFNNTTYFEQEGAKHAQMSDANLEIGLVALDAPLVAAALAKAKQADALLKQGQPGQALALYQAAASAAPASEESQAAQKQFDELLAVYQQDLAKVQAEVDAGDRVKSNAAIAAFAHHYGTWAKDDVSALQKKLMQARPAK